MARIELKNLRKEWVGAHAVAGIDLTIENGAFVAVLGPSGCGKSTTLMMLAGIYQPTSGDITFDGARVNDVEARGRNVEAAGGTVEPVEDYRPLDLRPPGNYRHCHIGAEVGCSAAAGDELRANHRRAPCEAAAELTVTFDGEPQRPERRRQRNGAVFDVEHELRQRKRLVVRRREQSVDLAPAHTTVNQPSAQPHTPSDDPIHFEAAVPRQPSLYMGEARGEIAYAASFLEWFAEEGRRAYGETIPSHNPQRRLMTIRQPIGTQAGELTGRVLEALNDPSAEHFDRVVPT